MLEVIGYLKLD